VSAPRTLSADICRALGRNDDNTFSVICNPSDRTSPAARCLRGVVLSLHFVEAISPRSDGATTRQRGKTCRCEAPYLFYDCSVDFILCMPIPGRHFR
jgi:hypothetical protein